MLKPLTIILLIVAASACGKLKIEGFSVDMTIEATKARLRGLGFTKIKELADQSRLGDRKIEFLRLIAARTVKKGLRKVKAFFAFKKMFGIKFFYEDDSPARFRHWQKRFGKALTRGGTYATFRVGEVLVKGRKDGRKMKVTNIPQARELGYPLP